MTQLTQEHFDQALKGLETRMKPYTDDQTDEIGRMINTAFQKHQDDYLEEKFERLTDTHSLQVELRSLTQRVDQLEKRRS